MLSIFFIGLALSMDAFSIALSIGLNKLSHFKRILIPTVVGIMHFIMPFLGNILGDEVLSIINIAPKLIVAMILFYLAIMMFMDRKNKKQSLISSYVSIFLMAFSVSIDSFSVGIGLSGLTNKHFLSFLIFSFCSFSITSIGLIVGKYSSKILKDKAIYLGIFILLVLSIVNFCQVLYD